MKITEITFGETNGGIGCGPVEGDTFVEIVLSDREHTVTVTASVLVGFYDLRLTSRPFLKELGFISDENGECGTFDGDVLDEITLEDYSYEFPEAHSPFHMDQSDRQQKSIMDSQYRNALLLGAMLLGFYEHYPDQFEDITASFMDSEVDDSVLKKFVDSIFCSCV